MAEKKRRKLVVPSARVGPPPREELERFPPLMVPVSGERLAGDLEKYAELALELGAEKAQVMRATDIPQDMRGYYSFCFFPRCRWLNSSLMCPQKRARVSWEDATGVMQEYHYAVVYKVPPPPDEVVAENAAKVGPIKLDMFYTAGGGAAPDQKTLLRDVVRLRTVAEMLRKVEQAAFYDGHLFAMSLGVGPCMVTWCSERGRCPGLEPGGYCLFLNSRTPGNAEFYVDYHLLARKLGWGDLQPNGNCAFPEDVPAFSGYYNIGITLID